MRGTLCIFLCFGPYSTPPLLFPPRRLSTRQSSSPPAPSWRSLWHLICLCPCFLCVRTNRQPSSLCHLLLCVIAVSRAKADLTSPLVSVSAEAIFLQKNCFSGLFQATTEMEFIPSSWAPFRLKHKLNY